MTPDTPGGAPLSGPLVAPDGRPEPMDLRRVLGVLPCGRTWLLAHFRAWPHFQGRPTHRYAGRAIVFTSADYATLVAVWSRGIVGIHAVGSKRSLAGGCPVGGGER